MSSDLTALVGHTALGYMTCRRRVAEVTDPNTCLDRASSASAALAAECGPAKPCGMRSGRYDTASDRGMSRTQTTSLAVAQMEDDVAAAQTVSRLSEACPALVLPSLAVCHLPCRVAEFRSP